eukprot:372244_1
MTHKVEVRASHDGSNITLAVKGTSSIADIINACYKAFNLEEYQFERSSWYLRYFPKKYEYSHKLLSDTGIMDEWIQETTEYQCPIDVDLLNKNSYKIPPRTNTFIEWLNSTHTTIDDIPKGIPYSEFCITGEFTMKTGNDRLWFAIGWKDYDVAKKLIQTGIFDLNMCTDTNKFTPINALCCAWGPHASCESEEGKAQRLALVDILLQNEDVDVRKPDIYARTPLANAMNINNKRQPNKSIVKLLLKHGINIDESVVKEMYCNYYDEENFKPKLWIYDLLKEVRDEYRNVMKSVLLSYESGYILDIVLDYMFVCEANVKNKCDKQMKQVKDWLENVVQLPQYYNEFIYWGFINMNKVSEAMSNRLGNMRLTIPNGNHEAKINEAIAHLKSNRDSN